MRSTLRFPNYFIAYQARQSATAPFAVAVSVELKGAEVADGPILPEQDRRYMSQRYPGATIEPLQDGGE